LEYALTIHHKFAQELLTTFGTAIGEIALIPATGGLFSVTLTYRPRVVAEPNADSSADSRTQDDDKLETKSVLLWDRKVEGGFPETKVLKQRVRDHIEPKKDLGHSDVGGKKGKANAISQDEPTDETFKKLEDCATCP
jgi:predicted Rdx family selenoprotein